jgi:hypothetical protein
MPGLVPGIHVFGLTESKSWMAGTCLREAKLRFGEGRQSRP